MKNKLTLIALLGLFLAGTYTVYAQDEYEYVPPTEENESIPTDDDIYLGEEEEATTVATEESENEEAAEKTPVEAGPGFTQKIKIK